MNIRYLLFGFGVLWSQLISAQDFKTTFPQLILQGKITEAITLFESYLDKEKLNSEYYYYATIAYAKNNDIDDALNQLEIALQKGLTNIETYNDGSLDPLKTTSAYPKLEKVLQENRRQGFVALKKRQKQLAQDFEESTTETSILLNMTPAKHQANRNTCSVFAATAIAEYLLGEKNSPLDLSESYNYYISKKKALNNDFLIDAYQSIDGLAGYLALDGYSYGTMTEAQWPYEPTNWLITGDSRCTSENGQSTMECFTGIPPENAKELANQFKTVYIPLDKIDSYLLNEKKPVLVNIWLYQNGLNMTTGEVTIPEKGKEILMGGHVVVLTGYDSATETFTFKNSWSNQWGTNGFGTIPKAYLLKHFEASKSIPFNRDASEEEKDYITKVSMGASLQLTKK